MKKMFVTLAVGMMLHAPAGAADPTEIRAHYLDMRTLTQSVQSGYLVEQCATKERVMFTS